MNYFLKSNSFIFPLSTSDDLCAEIRPKPVSFPFLSAKHGVSFTEEKMEREKLNGLPKVT